MVPAWREIARALCIAEPEFLGRMVERDEGDFAGRPAHPMIVGAALPEDSPAPISLTKLWEDYVRTRQQIGSQRDGGRRQRPVIASLRKFLGHDDARRMERKDVLAWRDHLLAELAPKTVSDVYLSAVRNLLTWAVDNGRLPENVAATVTQPKPKRVHARERGYTDAEALRVLKASRSYQPATYVGGKLREHPNTTAAKQWAPILCAFTGACVSEVTQLRRQDFRQEGPRWIMRITPEAGSVKASGHRDVPLHRQIIDLDFPAFLQAAAKGPLFHRGKNPARYAADAQRVSNQIADWMREAGLTPEGVQPSHCWRHRLKTQACDIGADPRVIDAI